MRSAAVAACRFSAGLMLEPRETKMVGIVGIVGNVGIAGIAGK